MSDIKQEQRAFDEQLSAMLKEHAEEYVVFHDERPVRFFPTLAEAYDHAINLFGPDGVFLVEQVARPSADISSLTWEVGAIGLQ